MFIAFRLSSTWTAAAAVDTNVDFRSNTNYLILKLFSGFSTNIITHLSNKDTAEAALADDGKLFIQLTLNNQLHQWPEYNILMPPLATGENETNAIIGDEIITPIISDYSYELNNDKYMLLYLRCGDTQISKLNSNQEVIHNSFCQFRTEVSNKSFKAYDNVNICAFQTPLAELGNLHIEFKHRNGEYFDLNNKDHSFTLKVTHLNNPSMLKDYQT